YCELLLGDRGSEDQSRDDILEIQKAGQSAAGLTRQLLAFSRKEIIEPRLLDLNAIVTGLRAMLRRLIGEDVTVALALCPEPALVRADPGQVEQIIVNLAVNARDAMPRGGKLTLETSNVEIDEHYARAYPSAKPGPYVALTVTDTGSGMTPEVKARLFEPYFTTKETGKGTSFKVYFPRVDSSEAAVEAAPPAVRTHDGIRTVLVVEDEDGLRSLAK